jgi:hypothetical protein
VAELGTSKSGGTISQLGCSTSVACHGSPRKQQQQPNIVVFMTVFFTLIFYIAMHSRVLYGSQNTEYYFTGHSVSLPVASEVR